MKPIIEESAILTLVRPDVVRPGDMVVFERDGSIVCHRIVGSEQNTVLTGGDNNSMFDMPFPASRIIAKVSHINNQPVPDPPVVHASDRVCTGVQFILPSGTSSSSLGETIELWSVQVTSLGNDQLTDSIQREALLRPFRMKGPIIGISELARKHISEMDLALLLSSHLTFLVGFSFGLPCSGLIPYSDVQSVVRTGVPRCSSSPAPFEQVLSFVVGFLSGIRHPEVSP